MGTQKSNKRICAGNGSQKAKPTQYAETNQNVQEITKKTSIDRQIFDYISYGKLLKNKIRALLFCQYKDYIICKTWTN